MSRYKRCAVFAVALKRFLYRVNSAILIEMFFKTRLEREKQAIIIENISTYIYIYSTYLPTYTYIFLLKQMNTWLTAQYIDIEIISSREVVTVLVAVSDRRGCLVSKIIMHTHTEIPIYRRPESRAQLSASLTVAGVAACVCFDDAGPDRANRHPVTFAFLGKYTIFSKNVKDSANIVLVDFHV